MNSKINSSGIFEHQDYRPVEDIFISREGLHASQSENIDQEPEYRTISGPPIQIDVDSACADRVSVFDVAQYVIMQLREPCSTMKLHKLLYYCQAWYLVWEDKPLFNEAIEAWANGPVVRELFNYHQGLYWATRDQISLGNPSKLNSTQKEDINSVLSFYGWRSSQWLIDQTHIEAPWRNARKGLSPNERGYRIISLESMSEYYGSLK